MQNTRDTATIRAQFGLLQQEFLYQDLLLLDTTLQLRYHQVHSFPFPSSSALPGTDFFPFLRTGLQRAQLGEIKLAVSPMLFTSTPVKNVSGQTIGLLLIKLSMAPLDYILHLRNGMGRTGESYVVGPDFRMRSHSRFFPQTPPHTLEVRTLATRNAFQKRNTPAVLTDYRNVPVLSAYQHLNNPGLDWVIVSEIDLEEAMQPVYRMRSVMVLTGIVICAVIALLTLFVSIPLSKRISRLRQVVLQLSKGVLPAEKLASSSQDEIGQMRDAINQLIGGMQRTATFASAIGNGHFHHSYEPLSPEDPMGNALLQMREKLQASQQKEETMSRQRITALLEGEENERRRIARELHDGIGQLLTAIQFKSNLIDGPADVRHEIKAILEETTTEVRRISHNLMPSVLIDFGLEAALRSLCTRTAQATGWRINFSFDAYPDAPPLAQENAIGLYRIAQEAIHNAVKYAQASQVDMIVDHEPEHLQLRIRDNGSGFDWDAYQKDVPPEAHGIRNMRERAGLLGGSFQMTTQSGGGTTLTVLVPLFNTGKHA
jgi:signal transduction histidine kinase